MLPCRSLLLLITLGTTTLSLGCRPPQAGYWKSRPDHPRPAGKPKLVLAWDQELAFCPERLEAAGAERVRLLGLEGELWLDASGKETAPAETPPAVQEPALTAALRAALSRRHGAEVGFTAAARWRDLAFVAVPEARTVHAVNVRKGRVAWTVHTAARVVAPPQLYEGRLLVQSLDNYVYCLIPDNGHELWRVMASHRLSRPAAFWRDRMLLIPETSRTLQVFDLFNGSAAGSWSLADPETVFTGPPVVVGGRVLAPHSRLGSSTCKLVALDLLPPPTGAPRPPAEPPAPPAGGA